MIENESSRSLKSCPFNSVSESKSFYDLKILNKVFTYKIKCYSLNYKKLRVFFSKVIVHFLK